ncbi:nodulation protein NolNO [Streptomyces ruber]|uniref:Nodulation protein NolNO n=2 Tax=Streptomyces TaxID=1883 RepID=A0A918EYU0_9ACTN|nr:nodulation protein NolNO [Streptomyces ruber]
MDAVAFFFDEAWTDKELFHQYVEHPDVMTSSARELIKDRVCELFRYELPDHRLSFVQHHDSHAYSVYPQSGFSDALVVVMDGRGESASTSIYSAAGDRVELLVSKGPADSLGHWYTAGTELLGYQLFDEYKVMGLAPYGNPDTYRPVLDELFELLPDGDFRLDHTRLRAAMFSAGFAPRRKNGLFEQRHMDFAATVQQVTEEAALHMIGHWLRATGHSRLALAGGVGQNCTLNGRLLRDQHLRDIFVHPASHDAGAALGAAIKVEADAVSTLPHRRIRDVFWGPSLALPEQTEALLKKWAGYLDVQRVANIEERAAELLASGRVIGWVQGRSEFGPRALGNRSILADPRPADNRQRVNLMVKKRETYRPFAPSVQTESLREWFEFPDDIDAPDFMVFTVPVLEHRRAELAAVTHVDGTARVHAVDRDVNNQFWRLLEEFEALTGVPVLLNTSFNNHAEPIVDSVEDAIRCFLTTELDHLVVGDFLISRSSYDRQALTGLVPSLCVDTVIVRESGPDRTERTVVTGEYTKAKRVPVSSRVAAVLLSADGERSLAELGLDLTAPSGVEALTEIELLWSERFLDLSPC